MTFVDRIREQRSALGLLPPRTPIFYDDNSEPVYADGIFDVEICDDDLVSS